MEGLNGYAAWRYHYDSGGGLDGHPIGGNVNTSPGTDTGRNKMDRVRSVQNTPCEGRVIQ